MIRWLGACAGCMPARSHVRTCLSSGQPNRQARESSSEVDRLRVRIQDLQSKHLAQAHELNTLQQAIPSPAPAPRRRPAAAERRGLRRLAHARSTLHTRTLARMCACTHERTHARAKCTHARARIPAGAACCTSPLCARGVRGACVACVLQPPRAPTGHNYIGHKSYVRLT